VRVFKEIRLAYVSNAVIGIVAERRSQRILQDCRGLASNLNRLGVDDSIIQGILRHSTVSVTQNHYIKTARPDTIAAMRKLSDALLCSPCAPTEVPKTPQVVH
jgi:integrase